MIMGGTYLIHDFMDFPDSDMESAPKQTNKQKMIEKVLVPQREPAVFSVLWWWWWGMPS